MRTTTKSIDIFSNMWHLLKSLTKAAYNFFLTVANARNGWRRIRNILTVLAY